jgi:opacity protein-like surface antigen
MMKRILIVAMLAAGLAACGEKAQTAQPAMKKSDGKAWEAAQSAYVAEGWKAGDQASWETQMRQRAQGQNEYNRAPALK